MSRGAPRLVAVVSLFSLLLVADICQPSGLAFAESIGQASPAPASLADRLKEADRLAAARRGVEARTLYLVVANQARTESRRDLEALAFESLGRLLSGDNQYADAQGFLERALPLAESIPDLRAVSRVASSLGNVAVNRGQYQDADAWYRKAASAAESAGDRRLLATSLMNVCLLDMTPAAEREKMQERVLAIARATGAADLEARVWHSRGDRHFAEGNFAVAMEELLTAVSLYEKAASLDDLATVYTSLGRLNRMHGLPLEAIPYYERAFDIQRKEGDKVGMVQSLNATGVACATAGDQEKALTFYERAYALAVESQSARAVAFMRGNLAGGLINTGRYARAVELLEALLADGGDAYPSVRHSQLSSAYEGIGRLEEARANAEKSVALATGTQVIQSLRRRAQVRILLRELDGALEDLTRAAGLIEEVRQKLVPRDFMKQGFTSQYLGVYAGMIAIYQGKGDAGRAIEVAESARARAFLDLLATREILPPSAAKPSDIGQLSAAAARTRSTIVTYWTTESEVFIGVVPATGPPQMARVPTASNRLASLVAAVGPPDVASTTSAAQAAAAWKSLHASLIEPVRQWLPARGGHLTIIPEGPLMRLPFAALATAAGRYLIEDYSISYVPAGAFLNAGGGRAAVPAAERRFLFVADPRLPPPPRGERALPPLPGAREEVRSVGRLVPASLTTLLAGEKATEPAVTGMMPGAVVLHFATHGVVDDRAPLDSYLALGLSEPPSGDGRLTAQELYGMRLRADLVVLSACRSAGGQVTGEGISALARAFLSAGAPSVVASVWDVPDKPAHRLIPALYGSWLQNGSPARALRTAQLRLIADLRAGKVVVPTVAGEVRLTESPVLWAGFIVIGGR